MRLFAVTKRAYKAPVRIHCVCIEPVRCVAGEKLKELLFRSSRSFNK